MNTTLLVYLPFQTVKKIRFTNSVWAKTYAGTFKHFNIATSTTANAEDGTESLMINPNLTPSENVMKIIEGANIDPKVEIPLEFADAPDDFSVMNECPNGKECKVNSAECKACPRYAFLKKYNRTNYSVFCKEVK